MSRTFRPRLPGLPPGAATLKVYGFGIRAFEAWAGQMGLSALPATPRTFVRYLYANRHWSPSTVSNSCAAIAHAHRQANLPSPTADVLVARYRAAARRHHGRQPLRRPGPLMDHHIDAIAATPIEQGRRDGMLFAYRDRSALLLSAEHRVHTRQLERFRRHHLEHRDGAIVATFPAIAPGPGRSALSAIEVNAVAGSVLHDLLVGLLAELDLRDELGDAVFNLLGGAPQGKAWASEKASSTAPAIRSRWQAAAGRTGRGIVITDPVQLDAEEVAAVSERLVPHRLRALRDRTFTVLGQALGCRVTELGRMCQEDLDPLPEGGWRWFLGRTKNHPDGDFWDIVHRHQSKTCPACVLGAWLQELGTLTTGAVFRAYTTGPALGRGGLSGAVTATGALAGIDTSGRAMRSGRASSAASSGATINEVADGIHCDDAPVVVAVRV